MRRVTILLGTLLMFVHPTTVIAGRGQDCGAGGDGSGINASCTSDDGSDQPPRPDLPPQPVCWWVAVAGNESSISLGTGANFQFGDIVYYRLPNGGAGRILADGTTQRAERQQCDDGTSGPIVWRTVTTMADLIRGSTESVTRQIPAPALAVNPAPEVGGYVNLGMWLAVGNADPITVRAGDDVVWAMATATLTSTSWAMGNGDVVTCDGPGTPLREGDPAWESTAQGPCGYTYTEVPPTEPYTVTMTAEWTIAWSTSTGSSGTSPAQTRTATFQYRVREIQTVGVNG